MELIKQFIIHQVMVGMDYNVEFVLTKPSNSLFVGYMTKATNSVS